MLLKPGTVDFDEGPQYPCMLVPDTWNGWAKPYFTKEQADIVAAEVGDTTYDPETDTFSTLDPNDDEDGPEPWETVEVDGVRYYGIGAGSWTWNYPDTDPWEADLVAGAWRMTKALATVLWSNGIKVGVEPSNTPALNAVLYASGHIDDVDELRTITTNALAKVDELGFPVSDKLRQHAEAFIAGENPFAD